MPSRAEKLLERARRSKSGWKLKDVIKLYEGFGFEVRAGKKHDVVSHPEYDQLRTTLPRHAVDLHKGYVQRAVAMIEFLLEANEPNEEENDDE